PGPRPAAAEAGAQHGAAIELHADRELRDRARRAHALLAEHERRRAARAAGVAPGALEIGELAIAADQRPAGPQRPRRARGGAPRGRRGRGAGRAARAAPPPGGRSGAARRARDPPPPPPAGGPGRGGGRGSRADRAAPPAAARPAPRARWRRRTAARRWRAR